MHVQSLHGEEPLEEKNGNPCQYCCLENSMDRRAWKAAVHGVRKSWTQLRDWTHNTHRFNYCSEFLIPFLLFTCMNRYICLLEVVIIQVGTSNIYCLVVLVLLYLFQSLSEGHILGSPLPRKMNSYLGRWIKNKHQDLANLETCSLKQGCPDTPTHQPRPGRYWLLHRQLSKPSWD